MTSSTQGRGLRERLRNSPVGNIIVISVTTLVILGGLWLVKALTGEGESGGTQPTAEGTGAVSKIDLPDSGDAAPEVGSPAPDFTALSVKGEAVTLSSFKGKPVWLVFGATWCSNCRAETPDIETLHKEFGHQVSIVAVNVGETVATVNDYSNRLKLSYQQVADVSKRVGTEYRVMGLPTHVFIDASGTIQAIDVGVISKPAATKRIDDLLAR